MLVLTRKRGEKIRIGDDIEIVVTKIWDGSVRLAIKAPPDTEIMRTELLPAEAKK